MRDNRSMLIIAVLITCIVIMMMTIVASAGGGVRTGAKAAVLYEPCNGDFIFEQNSSARLPMASTTKIMTALLAIENLNIDKTITVPVEATGIEGSSLYLKAGDVITVKDLIYSLLLQSANDAACALAIAVSGNVEAFATLMNKKADELNLQNTHFENPHGLDSEQHYTCARDLALIAAEALKNDFFKEVVSTYKYSFSISDKPRTVVNHNKLLRTYEGASGVKTGYTDSSGRCLVSSADRDGLTLIAVTLNDPDDWKDHKAILDYGFSHYECIPTEDLIQRSFIVPVIGSDKDSIKAEIENYDCIKLIKNRDDCDFKSDIEIKQYAIAPIKCGDVVGEITIKKGDEEIIRTSIIAKEEAKLKKDKKFGLSDLFKR